MGLKWKFPQDKYHNKPLEVDGWKFDSKAEAKYYQDLKIMKAAGEVLGWDYKPVFWLTPDIKYIADWTVYYSDGKIEVIDNKGGLETKEFILKKKLFNSSHPLAPLKVLFTSKEQIKKQFAKKYKNHKGG